MVTLDTINKLKEKLASAETPEQSKPLSKIGVMRVLHDEIEQKAKVGWRHEDIVQWMKKQGVEVSLNQFNRYLSDIRREKRLSVTAVQMASKSGPDIVKKEVAQEKITEKQSPKEERQIGKESAKPDKLLSDRPGQVPKVESVKAENVEESENVWAAKKPQVDAKGFVNQPGEAKNK